MEQIGSHILTDASTDELNGAVEGFALAVVTHDVQVTGAGGLLEVEAEMASFVLNRVEFQGRLFRRFGKNLNQEATAGVDAGAVHLLTHKHC